MTRPKRRKFRPKKLPAKNPLEQLRAELERLLPASLLPHLAQRDGAAKLVQALPQTYPPSAICAPRSAEEGPQRAWELCGLFFLFQDRFNDALPLFEALYFHILEFQKQTGQQSHKGMPLVWIAECHSRLGHPAIARRFLMLTLCEDAIRGQGKISADQSGVYFRLVWLNGMPDATFQEYSRKAYSVWIKQKSNSLFPEWILQELGSQWQNVNPSIAETTLYPSNPKYITHLVGLLGERSGKMLERLAQYLFSVIPGLICNTRLRTPSTDYDIVCSQYGLMVDFRSEIGRYFIGECKDWRKVVGTTTIAKFSHVLDTVKCNFGVIFSRQGISGKGKGTNAEREQIKTYQSKRVVIVVLAEDDLLRLAKGENFITMLRRKYERSRLDLRQELL